MTVYLDHAATAPLRPESREAWLRAAELVGNASSIHGEGQAARRLLEESRERLAVVLGCDAIEIVFTSGGTEAVNLGLKGLWWAREPGRDALVLPDGEHHATIDVAEWLAAAQDAEIRPVSLDGWGRIPIDAWRLALPQAAVATALVAANETGTLNDAASLASAAAAAGVPLHLDAIAAFGHVPVAFSTWRGDAAPATGLVALSVSGHKIGAPVGTGALVTARTARIAPLVHGGGQQRRLRAGTQDVAGAAAFATAAELAAAEMRREAARLAALRDDLVRGIRSAVPTVELLGDPDDRLPGNAHVLFPGAAGETLLFLLDQRGIAVSTGSACQAGVPEPSHVVRALGRSDAEAREVLRFTLGRTTTAADISAVLAVLPEVVERARAAR
ncbi:cysteine desulfurase family protein [Microbacterium sp. NPDC055910]|uniref:cysteine desulfurase family protein n=1 Tax=Microbacterium sp. NPDC055910 TaxID=3345659 RepID=UPI0035D6253C